MLLIKTRIGPSKIHGIGLFAAQFIPEGTAIWRFVPGFDLEISKDDFFKLSQPAQEQVLHYSYFDSDSKKYILSGDDARFFNHSKTPNTIDVDSEDEYGITIASKDIDEGEEITCDYEAFDDEYAVYERLLKHSQSTDHQTGHSDDHSRLSHTNSSCLLVVDLMSLCFCREQCILPEASSIIVSGPL